MKFSLNLAEYVSQRYDGGFDFAALDRPKLVQDMGLQLGAIEDTEDWGAQTDGVVVVKVVSCEKHPDADKLNICRVDDGGAVEGVERGDDDLVQVVCGAPNARADMFAAWIPPGQIVPSTRSTQEPFQLEAREIRGQISNGMLASEHELGMSDDHSGILDMTHEGFGVEPNPGMPLNDLGLNDFVVTCENKMFTHRPDCFGNLGIAREVAAISGGSMKSPDWYQDIPTFEDKGALELNVTNEASELVPRFMTVVMQGVSVGPSPAWLRASLNRVGIKSINNVVDASNYMMHLTGQPTHAFDYDKLQQYSDQPTLKVRKSNKGESIMLLGQKQVELTGEELVIATDKQAVALAGVMGGADTEVDASTKTIVIECATFDMYSIRRTSMRHGLFTDAVTRYTKGQSPLQNDRILAKLMDLLTGLAGAEQASSVTDIRELDQAIFDAQSLNPPVSVTTEFISQRLGAELSTEQVTELLQRVQFDVSHNGEELVITAPFWRTDIAIAEDIVEEVGRLYGYQNIPAVLPARSSKAPAKNELRDFKSSVRNQLVKLGANEVLTYSFVHGDLLRNTGVDPDKWAIRLRNALSPDLQYYRVSVLPSLLANVHKNIKAVAGTDGNAFALFEFGKAHVVGENEQDEANLPKQMRRLAFVVAADERAAIGTGPAYYQAKKYLDHITNGQATYASLETNDHPITGPYQQGRSAMVSVGGELLGVIGEFRPKAKKALKLPEHCAGFEIDMDLLQKTLVDVPYAPMGDYPVTRQDATYEVDANMPWGDFAAQLQEAVTTSAGDVEVNIAAKDVYQSEGSDKIRYTYSFELSHAQKTLTSDEVNKLLTKIDATLQNAAVRV